MELITDRGRLDTYDNFEWSLNYTTAEIVNLTGRKASYTKTIVLPYTGRNRLIFQGLDEWNVDNVGYNTKSSLRCFVSHNGSIQMFGSLVVLKFSKLKEKEEVEIQVVSSVKDLIAKLKRVKLNSLDFSRWNHVYSVPNILGSSEYGTCILDGNPYQFGAGKGYSYPLIDFGKDDTNGEIRWKVTDLRPCLYLKEYVDTIFRFAGLTYSSDFLDSPYFRAITLENTISELVLNGSQLAEFDSEVENTVGFKTYTDFGNAAPVPPNSYLPGGDPPFPTGIQWSNWYSNIPFTAEISDPLDQWDITGQGVFTANRTGKFMFKIDFQFYHEYTFDFQNPDIYTFLYLNGNGYQNIPVPSIIEDHFIQMMKNGVVIADEFSFRDANPNSLPIDATPWASGYPAGLIPYYWTGTGLRNQTAEFTIDLVEGDTIHFRTLDEDRDSFAPTNAHKAIIHRFNILSVDAKVNLIESIVEEGDILNFTNYVPSVDADAFIDGVFNLFNLWVLDDPNDEGNLIIEPRTNFFNGNNSLDMSKKLDISETMSSDFLASSLPRVYKYAFTPSDDVLNKIENDSGSPYADFDSVVDVDFSMDESIISTIFSPIISQEKNGLQYPLEYINNSGVKDKLGTFLKLGFLSRVEGNWEIIDKLANVTASTNYLRISEFSDITNPIYSLTFGDAEPKINLNTAPYWNLYRLFHQLTEQEYTRDGSKIVEAYFNLNENDIKNLDLRLPWFVNGVYYRIIEIADFNPTVNVSTKVRLLQVERPKFDFTSNEMIYKSNGIQFALSNNEGGVITTNNQEYVQPN